MQKTTEKQWPVLKEMGVGEYKTFPIERVTSIRSSVYQIGLESNRVFRTKVNREERTITVFRES